LNTFIIGFGFIRMIIMSQDVVDKALQKLHDLQIPYGDIRAENSLMTQIRTVNGRVEASTTGIESGVGIRILNEGAWGFAYGPLEKYEDVIDMALKANKLNLKQKKKDISLTKVKVVEDNFKGEQEKKLDDTGFDEKIEFTLEADKAQEDDRIKSRTSFFREVLRRMTLVTTEGTKIVYEVPYVMMYALSVAREGSETIEGRSRIGHIGGVELTDIRSPNQLGEKAKKKPWKV